MVTDDVIRGGGGVRGLMTFDDKGGGGVKNGPKIDYVICGWPPKNNYNYNYN